MATGETPEPIEYRARHADGSWHWMEARGNNQLDNPAIEGYAVNSSDITDRKEREQELERTNDLMSNMEELADVGAWEYDSETDRLLLTDGARRIHGLDPDADLTVEAAFETFHPDDRDRLEERFDTCLETGEPYEMDVRLTTPDGEQRWITARGERVTDNESGDVVRRYIEDITEQKQVERNLRQERDLVTGIVETSPVGIAVVTADGEVSFANDQASSIAGWPYEEVKDTSYNHSRYDMINEHGDPLASGDSAFDRVMSQEEPIHDHVIGMRRPSGERVWLSVSGAPQYNDDGELERAVFAFEDITERRELEAELSEILGRISDAFFALDDEYRVTHINGRAEELLEASEDELLGETLWDMYPEIEESDNIWDSLRTAMDTQDSQSLEFHSEPRDNCYDVRVYPSESGLSVYFRDVTERKNREQELQELKSQYQTLAENFPDGAVYLIDTDLECVRAGGEELSNVGLSPDDVEGRKPHALFPEEIAEELCHYYEEALDGAANTFEQEYEGERYRIQTVPVRTDDEKIDHVMAVSQNITERTERERTLTWMEYIVQNMNDGTVIVQDGVIKYANPHLSELVGYAEDELLGAAMEEFIAPGYRETVEKRHQARMAGDDADPPDQYELQLLSDDGQQIPVEVNISEIEYQGEPATLSLVRDITERTHQEERFQAFIEHSTDVVTVLNPDGSYQYQSPSSKRVLGYEPDELIGELAFEYVHPEDRERVIETFSEAVNDPELTPTIQYRFKHKDGSYIWLETVGTNRFENPGIEGLGILCNSRDITNRKQKEQKLERQNERLERFASVVSHDLRNPLTVAHGHLELAKKEGSSDNLDAIERGLERMEQLIDDVLTLAREGEQVQGTELVALSPVAERSWQNVATDEVLLVTETECSFQADQSRLQQLLENLFRNAVEHGGDEVTVTISDLEQGRGFAVADDGPGIPEEYVFTLRIQRPVQRELVRSSRCPERLA
jgi:PAS domain S-box-containing protein